MAHNTLTPDATMPVNGHGSGVDASGRSVLTVWCLAPDQLDHIRPVERAFGEEARFIYDTACDPDGLERARPDVVLCVNEFPLAIANCLNTARSLGIPTLLLQDGILEWRCQYENSLFGFGGGPPQHQPILADKIACLGEQSARIIRSWGNPDRVQVTGMPRLDHLLSRPRVARRSPGKCVLVMTAKNPGFTKEQREITIRSLMDVAAELKTRPDLEILWRIAPAIAREIGLENQLAAFSSQDLASTVERADAVITTLSTSILEAMLLDRPVAALDYHNVPRFQHTAWTISAREHILPVVDNLLAPAENKMRFQRFLLHDSLACEGAAAPRVAALIRRLVAASKANRSSDDAHALRAEETGELEATSAGYSEPLHLDRLYPHQPLFTIRDIPTLQGYVARLQRENMRLEQELRRRTMLNGLFKVGRLVSARLKKTR